MRLIDRLWRQVVGTTAVAVVLVGCASSPHRDFRLAEAHAPPSTANGAGAANVIDAKEKSFEDLHALLDSVRVRRGVPALGAVVLRGDEVVALGVAGVRRHGADVRVTTEDAFAIASCAKAMHAHVLAQLVEHGVLDWDRPVSTYFPEIAAHRDWSQVTLRHLVTHTAGLRDPTLAFLRSTYFDKSSLPERRAAFVRTILSRKLAAAPGKEVTYGNADYIVAAAVAEQVTKVSWEQLVREHVFQRLAMSRAGFGPPGEPGKVDQPWGHGKVRLLQIGVVGSFAFDPGSPAADYSAMASPAGFIHLSLRDWAQFTALHLRGHASNPDRNVRVLAAETFDTLHQARPGLPYAGGWFVETRAWAKGKRTTDVGRVLFHLGQNGRWSSATWLAPEIDLAILVVANEGDRLNVIDEISGLLVRRFASKPISGAQ